MKWWTGMPIFERILFVASGVCLIGIVLFIIGFSRVLIVFIPIGLLLGLVRLGYAVWGMLQVPLARRREKARARSRQDD